MDELKQKCEDFLNSHLCFYLAIEDFFINYDKRIGIFYRPHTIGKISGSENHRIEDYMRSHNLTHYVVEDNKIFIYW
jgi:hypothetical protein